MAAGQMRIGIDIGALFCKGVAIDDGGNIVRQDYRQHNGNPAGALEQTLRTLEVSDGQSVGITGSAAGLFADTLGVDLLDITRCQIAALRRLEPRARNIIDIGGGSVTLIQLDEQGNFLNYATNSLCAANTGSFLDEQAERLWARVLELVGETESAGDFPARPGILCAWCGFNAHCPAAEVPDRFAGGLRHAQSAG